MAKVSLFFPGFTARWDLPKAPAGWLIRDGKAVSRTKYKDLFNLLGTRFGKGNGRTTFNIPDDRAYFPRGAVMVPSQTFATSAVSAALDQITVADHRFNRTGFPVRFTTTTTLPAGLSLNTTYYVVWVNESIFSVATSEANALSGTLVNITDAGTGTHTVSQWADPDASTRTAQGPGGATADSVGSVQADQIAAHTHTTDFSGAAGGSASPAAPGGAFAAAVAGGSTGGNETHPKNISTFWIIKT